METIARTYVFFAHQPSDINEHLPRLLELSLECGSVAEMGVRGAVSTWAFLYGLCLAKKTTDKKQFVCIDLDAPTCLDQLCQLSHQCGIGFQFYKGDSATTTLPIVDMMFIDTWHVYAHLIRELEFHHNRVNKYIVLHDTEVDKFAGESIRENHNIQQKSKSSGYPEQDIMKGLYFAINEFLETHPEWSIKKHYTNNNGLTVLERTRINDI